MNHSQPLSIEEQVSALTWGAEKVLTRDELTRKLQAGRPLTVKLGVDPTAPDIHLGHTVVLRKLRRFQDLGHEAVLIIGGFTARIGDPSGKSKTRPPLSPEAIAENAATYLAQVKKILHPDRLKVVDNSDWLDELSLKDTLKLLSQGTMAKLLEHNTFKDRFGQTGSIRMHEFIYPFLQGYDSIHLQADVELGGTDQLFNIAFGRELQRDYEQESQVALLYPILNGTDGVQKMSKSLDNYIGVDESPKVMAQKIMNMPDGNILSYCRLLTDWSQEVVEGLAPMLLEGVDTDKILEIKNQLADEIIRIYHPGGSREDQDAFLIPEGEMQEDSISLVRAMVLVGFAASNREAVNFIQNGAVKVNDDRIDDRQFKISIKGEGVKLAVGKKKFITLTCA